MNRQAEIKCDSTQVCRIVIDNLLDWNRTFTYRNEDKHIIAFISEDDFDGLSLLCDVEFTEPTKDELDVLIEKATKLLEGTTSIHDFNLEWELEFGYYTIAGDYLCRWATIDGFGLNEDEELILTEGSDNYFIFDMVDATREKEVLEDIINILTNNK